MRVIFFLLLFHIAQGQQMPINDWSMHLNYTQVNTVIHINNNTFVGTRSGLFSYDLNDNSLRSFSKLDGLASLDITALAYDLENNQLIIGYRNGNMDVLKNNQITNIPYIAMANILAEKTINDIFIDDNLAYISCPFGLVVLNITNAEIKETYYFTQNGINAKVFDSHVFNNQINTSDDNFLADKIFVGTENGLFYANKNDNLLDFQVWKNDLSVDLFGVNYNLQNITVKKVVGYDQGDEGGKQLMISTMINSSDDAFAKWPTNNEFHFFTFNTNIEVIGGNIIETPIFNVNENIEGDIVSVNLNQTSGIITIITTHSKNQKIIILDEYFDIVLSENIADISLENTDLSIVDGVVADNFSVSEKIFLADSRGGLYVINEKLNVLDEICPNGPAGINAGSIISSGNAVMLTHGGKTTSWNNAYNHQEVSLFQNSKWSQSNQLINAGYYDAVAVCADNLNENRFFVGTWNSGLLEMEGDSLVNQYNENNSSLTTITDDGWIRIGGVDTDFNNALWMTNSLSEKPLVKFHNGSWTSFSVPNIPTSIMAGKILCTSNGQKWIQLRNNGVVIAQESGKGVISKKLGAVNGLASQTVNCFVEDLTGSIWVGTSQGLSVCYFPDDIFNNNNYAAEPILIETDDGYVEQLFENTEILDIRVDGGNRKWVGTKANGVFLISDDGINQIEHFTKENSALIDNNVSQIAIVEQLGTVFFVTPLGVCSYRGDATKSANNYNDVLVFPNPVRKNYAGEIAISGLKDNTNVKITDITGNLVFETLSIGGTATWDGKNFDGEKVATGIYLFLCIDANYDESVVEKILIYN